MTEKIKILFLAANPLTSSRLRLDEELREIEKRILMAAERDRFELISQWAVTPDDLQQALLRHQPHIIHFSGHGSQTPGIILEDQFGNSQLLSDSALVDLFKILKDNIRIILLNACYAKRQADGLSEVIDYTIGVGTPIADDAAILFAASFYQALAFGRLVKEAFDLANNRLKAQGIADANLPELLIRKGEKVSEPFLPSEAHEPGRSKQTNAQAIHHRRIAMSEGHEPGRSKQTNAQVGGDIKKKAIVMIGDHPSVSFSLLPPLKKSLAAVRAVLPLKYAFGAAGLIFFVAIIVALRINPLIAVLGAILMIILMILLVIFVRITKTASTYLTLPALIFVYFALTSSMFSITLLITSVFFNEPMKLKDLILKDLILQPPPAVSIPSATPSPRIGKAVDKSIPFSVDANYDPSGKMGDIGDLSIAKIDGAVRFTYQTRGKGPHKWDYTYVEHQLNSQQPAQFAGVAYLDPPNNWGNSLGGFDLRGYRVVKWEARSLRADSYRMYRKRLRRIKGLALSDPGHAIGNRSKDEIQVEFVIGGIVWMWDDIKKERVGVPYPDSLRRLSLKMKTLTPQWQSFEFNLASASIPEEELVCVLGGFMCIVNWESNGVKLNEAQTGPDHLKTMTFEVRNIHYER